MIYGRLLVGIAAIAMAATSPAQVDVGSSEIIVTGSRRSADNYDDKVPAVGLKMTADFAVQPLTITGDSRDPATRHDEMYQTIQRAVGLAASYGVQLAYGDTVVEPLTAANYKSVTFVKDNRPDSERTAILVKTPLGPNIDAHEATMRIDRFLKAVKPVGRALIEQQDDLTLSVVAPDKYRPQIAAKISEDARAVASQFGPTYAVEVKGLNRPVEWTRSGLTEVFLYIPYELTVVPKP